MRRRFAAAAVLVVAGATAAALTTAFAGGAARRPPQPSLAAVVSTCDMSNSQLMLASCYQRKLLALVDASGDAARELPRIDAFANRHGGYLQESCHILMHAVGRAYSLEHHLTLARIQDVLPRSNDPNCSAGFAHGTIMALGPQLLAAGTNAARIACHEGTRYERYSCVHGLGHAYMRMSYEDLPQALDSCRALGASFAADCAQGAFHDYWLSVTGSDQTRQAAHPVTSPRALCSRQRAIFVEPCWYRAYQEVAVPVRLGTPRALLRLCRGLAGLQRSGCLTAGSVESSPDPYEQAAICSRLAAADAVSCSHGIRAQALAGRKLATEVRLVRLCARFPGAARAGCAQWLGKVLTVVTNGTFERAGCGKLALPARAECVRGARAANGPLVTFS